MELRFSCTNPSICYVLLALTHRFIHGSISCYCFRCPSDPSDIEWHMLSIPSYIIRLYVCLMHLARRLIYRCISVMHQTCFIVCVDIVMDFKHLRMIKPVLSYALPQAFVCNFTRFWSPGIVIAWVCVSICVRQIWTRSAKHLSLGGWELGAFLRWWPPLILWVGPLIYLWPTLANISESYLLLFQ